MHFDEALVRVHAVGVNHLEAGMRAGYLTPFFNHFLPIIPGFDFAGEIVSAGYTLEEYQPGDRVLGAVLKDYVKNGTYAELVAVPGRLLARVPEGLGLIEAAALPTAGLAAWQALRPLVGEGDTVFINSASGGVGHIAVQLARHFGASTVVGACSPGNHAFVRSLGGIPTEYGPGIESRVAELVGGDGRVDVVLDLVGDETLDASFAIVRKPDHVVCLNPSAVEQRGGHFKGARPNRNDLEQLARLASTGDLHVEISKTIPLELAADAHHLIQDRHVRGKLVLSVKP
ncbi:NADP-dependent oxidoreductase [Streptomyces sp. NPDC001858]